jgi:hypothetical protein
MTNSSELVFERESSGESVGAGTRVRRMLVGTGAVLATVIVIVIAVPLLFGPTPREGAQTTSAGPILLERPALHGWEPLAPVAGELLAGFPPPMVRAGERVCIGFARVDFGADDLRPSLARCERHRADNMAANEIRSLVSVKSGFDTWHFIEAADDIETFKMRLATGEAVNDDRVHLSGSTAALRLENGRDLASVEWSTQSHRYRCLPDPTAWRTSEFCAASGDGADG